MRDAAGFAERLARALGGERFWDEAVEQRYATAGTAPGDRILQNRAELAAFLSWMHQHDVRSYLEIGIWTGRLLRLVDRLLAPQRVLGCDRLDARALGLTVSVPERAVIFVGDSTKLDYRLWREAQGHVDVVFIDADHTLEGVRRDFEINRRFPHRFLAFHDIRGGYPDTRGVRRFWEELTVGKKLEIVMPNPELRTDEAKMGIGIWWDGA